MGRLRACYSLVNRIKTKLFSHPQSHPNLQFQETKVSNGFSKPPMFNCRLFSTVSSANGVYGRDFFVGDQQDEQYSSMNSNQEEEIRFIPVKAYFLCTSVDLKSMQAENAYNVIPPTSRSSNYVALRYCDIPPEVTAFAGGSPRFSDSSPLPDYGNYLNVANGKGMNIKIHTKPQLSRLRMFLVSNRFFLSPIVHPSCIKGLGVNENAGCYRYMVVFQYGSAVLFNIADYEAEKYLELVRRHASGLLPDMRKDDYAVVEKPHLETWMQGGPDFIILKNLDTDGIRIIGSVLGQSIALDYFVRQVDGMVEEFTDINRGMEKTGTFTMQRKKLFQLVGKANSNLADVILKLGLFERSEIAWRNANYAQIWEYLRDEYELSQRFGSLDFKLKFVEHNIHFLQEILQNRKSDLLEWCIILLISLEILISLYEIVQESPIAPLKIL